MMILTIEQDGSTFELHMDTSSLGYNLSNDDEIVVGENLIRKYHIGLPFVDIY